MLFDAKHSSRLIAPTYAWVCEQRVVDSMLVDRPVNPPPTAGVRYDFFDTLSNRMGLIIARVGGPDYAQYLNRNEDYAACLRATAWLLANRGSANTPDDWRAQLTAALPALQMEGRRQFKINAAGDGLIIPYLQPRPNHRALVLPLMN